MHFEEPDNLAFLRPNYAATVVKLVEQLGGKPFLTDCNTLYVGGRKSALDRACVDMVNAQPPIQGTQLTEGNKKNHSDNLDTNHPQTNWRSGLDHAEK